MFDVIMVYPNGKETLICKNVSEKEASKAIKLKKAELVNSYGKNVANHIRFNVSGK